MQHASSGARPRPSADGTGKNLISYGAARRRGRPMLLPDDQTPMTSRSVNAASRFAWLLATTRSLSPSPNVAHRSSFVERMRALDLAVDATRVSRWESGAHGVPARVVLGYEQVVGLPDGVLLAAHRGLTRANDPAAASLEQVVFSTPDAPADRLAASLVEQATTTSAPMTGGDWVRLAIELTRFELLLLPQPTWDGICRRLLNELARTSGADKLRRYEAAVTLIEHPIAQRHVVSALGTWLTRPAVQVVSPLLPLLQHVPAEQASKLVLRLLDSDSRAISHGAVQIAAAKASRGHFQGAALALLEQRAIRELLTPLGQSGVDILDLVAHLPEPSYRKVTKTVRDTQLRQRLERARETSCLVPTEVARTLSRNIAQTAQAATPMSHAAEPDHLLQRLVRELIFHVHSSRRTLAARLLGISPYRAAVAEGCLDLALGEGHLVGARAWEAVWLLGPGTRRSEVATLATDDRHVWHQRRALTALGMCGDPLEADEAARVARIARESRHSGVRAAALLALGAGAPDHLHRMDSLPPAERLVAAWWLQIGPGLSDADAV